MKNIKVAMLFIGTVIGAGFATGKEVIVFFRDKNLFSLALAGLLLGVFCGIFLMFGKITTNLSKRNKIFIDKFMMVIEIVVFACTILSFCCMVCGINCIMYESFALKNFGLWTGVIIAFISIFSMDFAKNINLLLIPTIIALVIFLAFKSTPYYGGGFDIWTGIKYCCMNLLLGGFLISNEGGAMSYKDIACCTFLVSFIFAIMLCLVYMISWRYGTEQMPIFSFASSHGFGIVAGIIIFIAIFTTLLSCGKIITDTISQSIKNKWIGIIFLIFLTISSYKWNFAKAIETIYPIISIVGTIYCVIVMGMLTHLNITFHRDNCLQKLHTKDYIHANKSCKNTCKQ